MTESEKSSPQLDLSNIPRLVRRFFDVTPYEDLRHLPLIAVASNGKITINGDCVKKASVKRDKLPVSFDEVLGEFNVKEMGLTSLRGCPNKVGQNFWCESNKLTSLY